MSDHPESFRTSFLPKVVIHKFQGLLLSTALCTVMTTTSYAQDDFIGGTHEFLNGLSGGIVEVSAIVIQSGRTSGARAPTNDSHQGRRS